MKLGRLGWLFLIFALRTGASEGVGPPAAASQTAGPASSEGFPYPNARFGPEYELRGRSQRWAYRSLKAFNPVLNLPIELPIGFENIPTGSIAAATVMAHYMPYQYAVAGTMLTTMGGAFFGMVTGFGLNFTSKGRFREETARLCEPDECPFGLQGKR